MTLASPPDSTSNDELPPLHDPYFVAPSAPPPRERGSFLAGASVLTAVFLGPVGAIAAILFGWAAKREIRRSNRSDGATLATIGMILGVIFTIGWGAGLAVLVWHTRYHADPIADVDPDEPEPPQLGAPNAPLPFMPFPSARPSADPSPGGSVPKSTISAKVGQITIVDVGVSTSTLSDELAKQRSDALAAGEHMLVMTTKDACNPCRGVDRSLRDPLLQTALTKTRIVRVDVDVFRDDLDALHIPSKRIPGFYLLSPDLTPSDGIDGGEWDDDIPPNIAPVLGAFMRGVYKTRRQTWQPIPATGISL